MTVFDQACAAVLRYEGGFSDDPADPGNWTGGAVNVGVCRGTKWGISAAAYPTLDIVDLTEDDAQNIYRQRYWNAVSGDRLPSTLAVLVFDAAVNLGVSRAIRLLQNTVGSEPDGLLGPETLAAISAADPPTVCVEFHARRLLFMVGLPSWKTFGSGWARRLCQVMFDALSITDG